MNRTLHCQPLHIIHLSNVTIPPAWLYFRYLHNCCWAVRLTQGLTTSHPTATIVYLLMSTSVRIHPFFFKIVLILFISLISLRKPSFIRANLDFLIRKVCRNRLLYSWSTWWNKSNIVDCSPVCCISGRLFISQNFCHTIICWSKFQIHKIKS